MTIIVFTGPTLPAVEARSLLDADYRPPAAQGDVYRAALERPWGIAIIDGFFERLPAVWHKEILWALSRGIHVFGSSSMGALRAAELHTFGMIGVGTIFEGFRDESLTDDDEVTLVHGPAETGYRPMSVALVDMRATLARATQQGIIDRALWEQLLDLAKRRHYSQRTYPTLFDDALVAGVERLYVDKLRDWTRDNAVELKKADARMLLRSLAPWRAAHPEPRQVDFTFEHTDAWQQLTQRIAADRDESAPDDLLDELRLQPDACRSALGRALTRKLASQLARHLGLALDDGSVERTIEAFRRERGLYSAEAATAWWRAQGLDRAAFLELMERETLVRLVSGAAQRDLHSDLLDELRLAGSYATLATRADAKRARLEHAGPDPRTLAPSIAAWSDERLIAWYFASIGQELPDDLGRYSRELGFSDLSSFKRALLRHACCAAAVKEPSNQPASTRIEV